MRAKAVPDALYLFYFIFFFKGIKKVAVVIKGLNRHRPFHVFYNAATVDLAPECVWSLIIPSNGRGGLRKHIKVAISFGRSLRATAGWTAGQRAGTCANIQLCVFNALCHVRCVFQTGGF